MVNSTMNSATTKPEKMRGKEKIFFEKIRFLSLGKEMKEEKKNLSPINDHIKRKTLKRECI